MIGEKKVEEEKNKIATFHGNTLYKTGENTDRSVENSPKYDKGRFSIYQRSPTATAVIPSSLGKCFVSFAPYELKVSKSIDII